MKNQNQKKSPEEQILNIGYKNKVFNFLIDVNRENFLKCVKIIGKYNNFDYQLIKENFKLINLDCYINENNPNNGSSLFTFKIGREFSPVIYITFFKTTNYYFGENKKIKKMYDEDFKNLMFKFKEKTKADEIYFEEDKFYIDCRLWWD